MALPIQVPQIHDEPVASVLRILQLEQADPEKGAPDPALGTETNNSYWGASLPQIRRVYGGQVIAQALLAAAATVNEDISQQTRLPHSLHAYFLRGGNPYELMRFDVGRLHDGRSFSSRAITAWQDDTKILTMNASFQAGEGGPESQSTAPSVPGPEDVKSALELFRTMDHPVAKFLGKTAAFDVRHVQRSLYTEPAPKPSSSQEIWMRPRAEIPVETPQVVQRALLAYVVDQVMLEPSLRSVGLTWSTPGLSLASLDHAMWFHRDVDINEWLLFVGRSSAVQGSRAKADIRVFTREGELVASASQEGMVRIPTGAQQSSGRWTFTD